MLPAHHRLRASRDFVVVLRSGRRGGSPTVVVHALTQSDSQAPPRIGFAVSRAVGNSVVRHRVARRLRALLGSRLDRLAPGTSVVVRALPKAAAASQEQLGADVDAALASAGL
jgi:ribonuclease P protein component